jgi:cytochrome c553
MKIRADKVKAAKWMACHDTNGISMNYHCPNFSGQKSAYISKRLQAYIKDGRTDFMMGPIARKLTDADIENRASYYRQPGGV